MAVINIVVMPSHWINAVHVPVDTATREEAQANLTWMLCRPFAFLPPVKYRDHRQWAPSTWKSVCRSKRPSSLGCTISTGRDLITGWPSAYPWNDSPLNNMNNSGIGWRVVDAQPPHHDGASEALRTPKCTAMHAVPAVRQQPRYGPSPVGMPGAVP